MRPVRDESGNRYLVVKESAETSRVRDPETGDEQYIENERLESLDGESPLETAAGAVPAELRGLLTAVQDDRSLGLLLEIDTRGPVGVRALLSGYDLCESDLHGLLAEFQAAGLITETETDGGRGYRTTETASDGLGHLTSEVS